MKTLRKILLAAALWGCVLSSLVIQGCPPPEVTKIPNHLIVIGEDLSGTFSNFTPLEVEDLEAVCQTMQQKKRGGKIILIGIGSTTPKGHITCKIIPLHEVNRAKPVHEQLKAKKQNENIKAKNDQAIEAFLEKAGALLKQRNQQYTDINGFLDKATLLMGTTNFDGYTKWLYMNTDGKQDTKNTNKVDCSLLPETTHFLTSGWKKKPDCEPAEKFLSPKEFIEHLTINL